MAATRGSPARYATDNKFHDDDRNSKFSEEFVVNSSDTVFWFLDQLGQASASTTSDYSGEQYGDSDILDEEEEGGGGDAAALIEENKAFWENHHNLLRETICKTSTLERRIREATREALKEAQKEGRVCTCRRPVGGACRSCLMREIAVRLQNSGYNCAVCKSKWRSSPDMPSGEHTFLDVINSMSPQKKEIRVIIELSFRAEFEMGWASDEYKRLIARLPEAFVGKAERLKTLIKILCSAAKKSMESNKIHMGPWRKQNYMLAKWFSSCDRLETLTRPVAQSPVEQPVLRTRSSNSMLTVVLLDLMPNMPYKALMVV